MSFWRERGEILKDMGEFRHFFGGGDVLLPPRFFIDGIQKNAEKEGEREGERKMARALLRARL